MSELNTNKNGSHKMNREELLEEKYRLLCLSDLLKESPLIGEKIRTSQYGPGTIVNQTPLKVVMDFNGEYREFITSPAECFYELPKAEDINEKLQDITRQLERFPTTVDLIKKLVDSWYWGGSHGEYYINKLIPGLMKGSIKGEPEEVELINSLRKMMSDKDWSNLPSIALSIHNGEKPLLSDDENYRLEEEIRQKSKQIIRKDCLNNTSAIIEKIIAEEIRKENELAAVSILNSYFNSDYLSAREFYNTDYASYIDDNIFENSRIAFLTSWFAGKASNMPDNDQLSAIGALEQNVQVVARAGSGKTSTIINRTRFLIEHCHIEPSSILMLAFNRKAAEEMRSRMEKLSKENAWEVTTLPHIMTFHALAYSIVNPEETLIYNDDKDDILYQFIQNIITDSLQNESFMHKVRDIMLSHFKGNWELIVKGGYNLSQAEMLKYRRNLSYFSLRGDNVRSEEVRLIANILFEHNINYSYSQSFNISKDSHRTFDFIIYPSGKSKPIIIDCVDSDEKKNAYQSLNIQQLKGRVNYIKLDSSDFNMGEKHITELVKALVISYGMPFDKLTENEIWEKIKERSVDNFTEAVTGFIGRCRKECLSPKQLEARMIQYHSASTTENKFLDVALDIYYLYDECLAAQHKEDFDGLMQHAISLVKGGQSAFGKQSSPGKLDQLKHILIDEYQDFSLLFDSFIEAIKGHCPSVYTFCVGDDWQALNGFAGSKVKYFESFKTRFNDTGVYDILTNYRSTQEIVNLGTALMDPGLRDAIKASRYAKGIIKLGYYDDFPVSETESHYGYDIHSAALLRLVYDSLKREKDTAVLSRIRDGIPESLYRLKRELSQPKNQRHSFPNWIASADYTETTLDLFTVHKYKGKEKTVVIITDATSRRFPLIHPNWIFQRIFGDTIEKIVKDEQRLFYVALTRAVDELIILSEKGNESPFLLDTLQYNKNNVQKLKWSDYVSAPIGKLNGRIEVSNEFYKQSWPTINIKSYLRDAGYTYNGEKRNWSLLMEADQMDPDIILKQKWAQAADRVVVSFFINDACIEKYLISKGLPQSIK